MEDHELVDHHIDTNHATISDSAYAAWIRVFTRETGGRLVLAGYRDYETVAAALYATTAPPPEVTEAWCRIVARERARMGLPDPSLVRSAAIGYLMEFGGSMGALELVDLGAYRNLATAHVMLRDLASQGRIRRVGRGVYALPVAS